MQPPDTTLVVFAGQLRALMQERKVTQVRLAQEFRVSQAAVSKWLRGTVPSGETLVRLAHFFGVTPEQLVGLDSRRQPEAKPAGGELFAQSVAGLGKPHSLAGLDAKADALFEKLKSRVKVGLSGCSPKEIEARLKILKDLFGTDDLLRTKRKR
jgi:transcriptional regulator with XRE-family HTH domain